jgi:hypothetical protein
MGSSPYIRYLSARIWRVIAPVSSRVIEIWWLTYS